MGRVAVHFCKVRLTAKKPLPDLYPQILKTTGDHLRKARIDKGLSQVQVSMLLDVDEMTLCAWELGHHDVQVRHMPKVISFLGYNPVVPNATTIGDKLKALRLEHGMSVKKLIPIIGMDGNTIARIEANDPNIKKKTLIRIRLFLKNS